MKVNIICRNPESDRIIPRLACQLSEATGWMISPYPDPRVDINYYFPYLELFGDGADGQTVTAAWFTHRDTAQKGKGKLWEQAAAKVDLRTVSADKVYHDDLSKHGMTRVVTPPLDIGKFRPDPKREKADVPVIGTSGYVYPGGRKGEHLVKQLASEDLGIHLIAAGRGWPVRCAEWDFAELEKFYQGLDVYLCTSLIEGVGYGPLEALACGVPVVIPENVGVLDNLPDMRGIYRYPIDDYAKMLEALLVAMDSYHKPDDLRESVSGYTLCAWADDHLRAFEDLLYPAEKPKALPEQYGRCGVYYVAFGEPSRQVADKAIKSFAAYMPDVPIALVSDSPLDAGETYFLEQPDRDIGGRIAKINMDNLAPAAWQYILYLDADTEIIADISVLFQFLVDGWELVICKNPDKYHVMSEMIRPDNLDEAEYTFEVLGSSNVLQLNGGVLAYRRNERTKRFFELWLEEWNRYGKRDQAALHRALWRQPLRVYVLGNEWNTVTRYDEPEISAGILHYPTTARRWAGRIDGRLDSQEAWQAVNE